jgi:transposase-like protein
MAKKTAAKPAAPARAPRRSYSEEQKTRALELYQEHGVREAARQTQIPRTTIGAWATRLGLRTDAPQKTAAAVEAARAKRQLLREEANTLFAEQLVEALQRMNRPHLQPITVRDGREEGSHVELVELPHPTAAGFRDYAVAAGILLDKIRLELGETTERKQLDLGLGNVGNDDLDFSIAAFIRARLRRADRAQQG